MAADLEKILGKFAYTFTGDTLNKKLKQFSDADLTLKKHPYTIKFIVEEAVYSGVNAIPLREFPVLMDSTEISGNNITPGLEGIIYPKGTIVSVVTCNTPSAEGDGIMPSGIDKFPKYDRSINAAIVPANGGVDAEYTYEYPNLDLKASDEATTLTIKANKPYGILAETVFQNVEGDFLNYDRQPYISTIKNGRVWVPFVNVSKVDSFGTFDTRTTTAYGEVYKDYQFVMITDDTDSGSLLKADKFGKFMIESDAVNANVTVQTVAKIMQLDCRFPKALDAMKQSYPGMLLKGTITQGIPDELFIFVARILKKVGAPYTKEAVLAAILNGSFGMAKIDLYVK